MWNQCVVHVSVYLSLSISWYSFFSVPPHTGCGLWLLCEFNWFVCFVMVFPVEAGWDCFCHRSFFVYCQRKFPHLLYLFSPHPLKHSLCHPVVIWTFFGCFFFVLSLHPSNFPYCKTGIRWYFCFLFICLHLVVPVCIVCNREINFNWSHIYLYIENTLYVRKCRYCEHKNTFVQFQGIFNGK